MECGAFGAKSVRELLAGYGFSASKALGQNFLIDENIPEKIVRLAGLGGSDGVLEVGAGLGSLTLALSRVVGRVVAVEIDKRLLPLLSEAFVGISNIGLVQGDILKMDVNKLVIDEMPGLSRHVCANLPYSITTPALTSFINAGVFKTITVMIQREVAQRICAKTGSTEYGAFTVFACYHTKPEMLFDVPPECFFPRPGVYSSVVILRTLDERILAPEEEPLFFRVVRAAFGQRRKTLVNALFAMFGNELQKGAIAELVRECGFDERVRGEALGVDEFARLSRLIRGQGA